MKHNYLTIAAAALTISTACTPTHKITQEVTIETIVQEMSKPCFLFTDSLLPQSLDLTQDISTYSYQELRLLRSYPYALHGYWFMEGDINAFFTQHTDWYYNLCDSLYWKYEEDGGAYMEAKENGTLDKNTPKPEELWKIVRFTPEEKAFVERIDQRMRELESDYADGPLGNPLLCVNLFQVENTDKEFAEKMTTMNFAIAETDYEQLFHVYEANDYHAMPSFITTDVFLQATHMYFSYVLKYLEQKTLTPILLRGIEALHGECMKTLQTTEADSTLQDCAAWNTAFFAIAGQLLGGTACTIPDRYITECRDELARIEAQQDENSPFLDYMDVYFPYSLFKPRGHYSRNETTQRYFKTMMWLQTASFCRDDRTQLSRAVFMALAFNALPEKTRSELLGVFDALTFLMGEPDNLSVMEIAAWLQERGITRMSAATDGIVLEEVDSMLAEAFKTRNRIKPKVELSCTEKINFMPQRYAADNEILGAMADEKPNAKRAYPKGLDVMATFGCYAAEQILDTCYHEKEQWTDYEKTRSDMNRKFAKGIGSTASMYNQWLGLLMQLQAIDKDQPAFTQTPAWQCKTLNTALASWAELKHDAILYSEQPIMAECGGAGLPDPVVVGYVEPNPTFWKGLKDMLAANRKLLKQARLLDETLAEKSRRLEEEVDFCLRMAEKELAGQVLTPEEYNNIKKMGSTLDWFTLGILDPDNPYLTWDNVKGADRSVAVVADVFTRNILGCEKNGILHEATGNADNIYVLVNIGGTMYLTSGAVLRYYEFVRPLGERLTDEEWQQMLQDGKAPEIPEWMRPLKLKQKPKHNEAFIYSSGC